jgi:N-acetylmuramoyl-L-alanine amidase
MDAPAPDRSDERPDVWSRRLLLRLAGGVGLVSIVSACSSKTPIDSVSASATGPRPPSSPNPVATSATGASLTESPSPGPRISHPPALSTNPALFLCRDAWGARPARLGGRLHSITRMTLHHEGVVLGDNRNAPGRLRQDQQYHQDQRGWIDIAYHVGVDRNGNIYELRSTEIAGDTATDYDTTGHFLVLCEGDFDQEVVTEAQLHGAALAFAWAAQNFGIATDTLAGHRDLAQTSCPGANLYAHVASGDLKRRIDDLLAAGGVDLQRFCGPDAASRVAAIEAGN